MRNRLDMAPSCWPRSAASQLHPPALAYGPSPRLAPPRRRRNHTPRLVRVLGSACGPGQPTSLPKGRSTSQLAFPAAASSSTVLPEGHGHGGSGRQPDGTTGRPSRGSPSPSRPRGTMGLHAGPSAFLHIHPTNPPDSLGKLAKITSYPHQNLPVIPLQKTV